MRTTTPRPIIHAETQSAQRRNTVHRCDQWTISPHTADWEHEDQVTCPRCLRELGRIARELRGEVGQPGAVGSMPTPLANEAKKAN